MFASTGEIFYSTNFAVSWFSRTIPGVTTPGYRECDIIADGQTVYVGEYYGGIFSGVFV